MPFALILAGIVLTVAGVRSTENALFSLLKNDFVGTPSFVWWTLSILAIGSVGYLPGMRQLANAFLALILIVLILANNKDGKNVFSEFFNTFKQPIPAAPVAGNGVVSAIASVGNSIQDAIGSIPLGGMNVGQFNQSVTAMSNLSGL